MILSVPDEGYSRNAIHLISTFYYISFWIHLYLSFVLNITVGMNKSYKWKRNKLNLMCTTRFWNNPKGGTLVLRGLES